MQSIFLFLNEKKCPWGIRFSLENYASFDKIKVSPLYAVKEMIGDNS
jgi:uncharacterized protein